MKKYIGHTGLVSSMVYQCKNLISVSWDRYLFNSLCNIVVTFIDHYNCLFIQSTMRVWSSNGKCDVVEAAHQLAAWCVAGLYGFDGSNRVLTGFVYFIIVVFASLQTVTILSYL